MCIFHVYCTCIFILEVGIDTLEIFENGIFNYPVSIIQGNGKLTMMLHIILEQVG